MDKFFDRMFKPINLLLVLSVILFSFAWEARAALQDKGIYVLLMIAALAGVAAYFWLNGTGNNVFYIHGYKLKTLKERLIYAAALVLAMSFAAILYVKGLVLPSLAVVSVLFVYSASFFRVDNTESLETAYGTHPQPSDIKLLPAVAVVVLVILAQILMSSGMLLQSFFAVCAAALFMRYTPAASLQQEREDKNKYLSEKYLLLIAAAAAVFLRYYKLDVLPPGHDNDARVTFDLVTILNKRSIGNIITDYGGGVGSVIDSYITVFFMKLAGFSIFKQRFFETTLSLVSLGFLYGSVKMLYDRKTALVSFLFGAVFFMSVSMSRTDITVYRTNLYLLMSLFFLLKALKEGRAGYFFFSGTALALNVYAYHSGKMAVPVILSAYLLMGGVFVNKKAGAGRFTGLLLVLISALVLSLPMIGVLAAKWNSYFAYSSNFAIKASGLQLLDRLYSEFVIVLNAFTVKGTEHFTNVLPGRDLLAGPEKILFWTGAALLLYGIRNRINTFVILWMLFAMFPMVYYPYVFSLYYYRMVLVFPVMCVIAALGFMAVYRILAGYFPAKKQLIFVIMFISVLGYSFTNTFSDYFVKFAENSRVKDRYGYVAFKLEDLVLKNMKKNKIIVSEYFLKENRSLFFMQRVMAKNEPGAFEYKDVSLLKPADFYSADRDVMIIAEGIYSRYFEYLREYFPNMIIEAPENNSSLSWGVDPAVPGVLYSIVRIPKEDIKNAYGLNIYEKEQGRYLKKNIFANSYFVKANAETMIKGLIDIPENTKYRFSSGSAGNAVFVIDGRLYDGYRLAKGLHEIEIRFNEWQGGQFVLYMEYGGNKSIVEQKRLLRAENLYGINAQYKYYIKTEETYNQNEPVMISRVYWYKPRMELDDDAGQYSIIWRGYYMAEKDGAYKFELDSYKHFCNNIQINGKEIANYTSDGSYSRSVKLDKGWHKVEISSHSFLDIPDAAAFYYRLMVTPPDGIRRVVRYDELNPIKPLN